MKLSRHLFHQPKESFPSTANLSELNKTSTSYTDLASFQDNAQAMGLMMMEVLKQFFLLKSLACSWLQRVCHIWLPEKEVVSFALIALAPIGDLLA